MRVCREPPGEEVSVAVGKRHGGAEERMTGRALAHRAHVAGGGGGVEPVALALERVGGQIDTPGTREEGFPVQLDAGDV
ncbi:hypothetical protein GCM10010422_01670 [Streptomyces graminearus]|uniref:Uncharacterized protein n=1 Tax=Streptomyces graminearus TaxID=284030 RepID=A0ABP5XTT1_9ACTN